MGTCFSSKPCPKTIVLIQHHYPRSVTITPRVPHQNLISQNQKLRITLTQPILSQSHLILQNHHQYWVSSCILPGQDPLNQYPKQCQDLCFYLQKPSSLLLVLFDGHGQQGHKLVQFCKQVVQSYFSENYQQQDPQQLLKNLSLKCDSKVKLPIYPIDAYFSGTTAVFMLIKDQKIYTASVGDSRAIIATQDPPQITPFPQAKLQQTRTQTLIEIKLEVPLWPIQLTLDQKPDDPQEYQRIIKSGGRVQRLQGENGEFVGPYRVWQYHQDTPGLAMSRSIGDQIGSFIGVIATPVTCVYQIRPNDDYFIVIASDGVWDVITNQDVVNFVEFYREKCRKGFKKVEIVQNIRPNTACIAQLLCEEARNRWLGVVEEEKVVIDDISCHVLELKVRNPLIDSYYRRRVKKKSQVLQKEEIDRVFKPPSIRDARIGDPIRSSMIEN